MGGTYLSARLPVCGLPATGRYPPKVDRRRPIEGEKGKKKKRKRKKKKRRRKPSASPCPRTDVASPVH
ncbi:hypothetical protein B296_00036326, partial [Ensete ventricosum]